MPVDGQSQPNQPKSLMFFTGVNMLSAVSPALLTKEILMVTITSAVPDALPVWLPVTIYGIVNGQPVTIYGTTLTAE